MPVGSGEKLLVSVPRPAAKMRKSGLRVAKGASCRPRAAVPRSRGGSLRCAIDPVAVAPRTVPPVGCARQCDRVGAALEEQPGYVLPREPSEPSICRLVQYWRCRCVEGRLPARADIDPVALPYILANIFLLDVRRDEEPRRRFRFR